MEQGMKAIGKWRSARLKINQKRKDMLREVDLHQLLNFPLKWVHLERFICILWDISAINCNAID